MLKRITAWMLVLALLVSVMPQLSLSVTAEGTATPPAEHSHTAAQHDCEHCDEAVTWQAWGDTEAEKKSLPTVSGHYYLVSNVTVKAASNVTAGATLDGTDDVALCLNGYTIDGSALGEIYWLKNSAKLTISDCTAYTDQEGVYHAGRIQNGYFNGGIAGGFSVWNAAQLIMHGGIVSDNSNTGPSEGYSGGAIHLRGGSGTNPKAILNNVVFENNSTNREGGAICLRGANAELIATNCTFQNNEAAYGGAIYAMGAKVILTGCTVRNNKASGVGGAAIYLKDADLSMDNCTMTGNELTVAKSAGGSAIYSYRGSHITLKDCTITGNNFAGTDTGTRGAVYLSTSSDVLKLVGKTVIKENYAGTDGTPTERGICLQKANAVDVGGLTQGAQVTIRTDWGTEATATMVKAETDPTTWNRLWVIYEGNGMAIDYNSVDDFHFALNTDHIHCQCGASECADSSHKKVEYMPWTNAAALPESGNYYLATEVVPAAEASVTGELNLCLNGHNIVTTSGKAARFFNLLGSGKLNITDCTGTPGTISGARTSAVLLENNAASKTVFNLYNGTFTNNGAAYGGGAVIVQGGGTFNMYGGSLIDNHATAMAQVKADGSPDLDSKNVQKVKGNLGGGAVCIFGGNATFNFYGGTIEGNKAVSCQRQKADGSLETVGGSGGAIYTEGKLNLQGGTITGNLADMWGGAIHASGKNAAVTLAGTVITLNESKSAGGAMLLDNSSTLVVSGGKITGNKSASGGGLYCSTGTAMTMTGGEITQNTSTGDGGGIYLLRSVATLSGGTVSGNAARNSGGGVVCKGANLKLQGTAITDNTAVSYGGGIKTGHEKVGAQYIGATVEMTAGTLSKNTASLGGGIILEGTNSQMTMTGGQITQNEASNQGGGILVNTSTTFTLAGGKIADNLAGAGGGIYLYKSAASISGGEITGNTAQGYGGGIRCDQSELQLSGGKVTANIGGGVYLPENSKLTLSGETTIVGNTKNEAANNLYLNGNVLISLGTLGENAKIAVSAQKVFRPITGQTQDYAGLFLSDNAALQVVYQNNVLYLGAAGGHGHCLCNAKLSSGCSHDAVVFAQWSDPDSLPASGNWYLTADVALAQMVTVSGELNLCLNGHSITAGGAKRFFTLTGTGKLAIADCQQNPGKISGAVHSVVLFEYNDASKPVLDLYNGVITGCSGYYGGGAVMLQGSGTFNMYGGALTGNTVKAEAVVDAGGAPVMNSQNVQETFGYLGGGAVCSFGGNATFNLYGGIISDNHVTACQRQKADGTMETVGGSGGAIYSEGPVNLYGGTIFGNSAEIWGGAIHARGRNALVTVQGTTIRDNRSGSAGGAILVDNRGSLQVADGKVAGNSSATGGGMYISTNCSLNMTGGAVEGNSANADGGGIYLLRSQAVLSGGTVTGNAAGANGGGIVCKGATLELKGTEVTKNSAVKNGGGVKTGEEKAGGKTYSANVVLSNSIISQNSAALAGGVLLEGVGSQMVMTGGEISKNTATGNAGGLWVSTKTTFTMEDGKIADNQAKYGGGAVLYKSNSIFKGGEVTGNTATKNAGGLCLSKQETTASLQGTTISKNRAENGGGVLVEDRATLELKSGKVTGNTTTTGGGAGLYISINSSLKMTGGSVTGNTAKGNGGGIYGLQANMTLAGGSISYNHAKNGAGLQASAGEVMLCGTDILSNNAETGNGGGVRVIWRQVEKDGAVTSYPCKAVMTGGTISGNVAINGGGVLVEGTDTAMEMRGGSITGNRALKNGGGLFVSTKTTFTATGGSILDNKAEAGGGGAVYQLRSKGSYKNCDIAGNIASGSAGAVYCTSDSSIQMEKVTVRNNSCKYYGGAIYMNNDVPGTYTDCTFSGNSGNNGGAVFNHYGAGAVFSNTVFIDNTASAAGGAVFSSDTASFTNCTLTGNQAERGGAIYTGDEAQRIACNGWGTKGSNVGITVDSCNISGNVSLTTGGGLHMTMGCYTDMRNTELTGNTSGTEGSAIWAEENLTMTNVTVTGNTSKNSGHAVYLSDSEYDGQSYIKGLMKMGGNMIIKDNQGGDMYLGNKVTVIASSQGLDKDTQVGITLDTGLLTQRVYGAYNYEGGDCVYTITYGDRSLTDPEELPAEETLTERSAVDNTLLYMGVCVFVVALAAAAVLILLVKKKKAGKMPADSTQE